MANRPLPATSVAKALKDSPITLDQRLSMVRQKIEEISQDLANANRMLVGLLLQAKDEDELTAAYIRVFRVARDMDDVITEGGKPIKGICEEMKLQKLPEAYDAAGIKTLTLESGDRVSLSDTVRANIKAGMKEAALKWLKSSKKTKPLVTETVNAGTLSAYAGTLLEGNLSLPEELFNVAVITAASLTRGKKK